MAMETHTEFLPLEPRSCPNIPASRPTKGKENIDKAQNYIFNLNRGCIFAGCTFKPITRHCVQQGVSASGEDRCRCLRGCGRRHCIGSTEAATRWKRLRQACCEPCRCTRTLTFCLLEEHSGRIFCYRCSFKPVTPYESPAFSSGSRKTNPVAVSQSHDPACPLHPVSCKAAGITHFETQGPHAQPQHQLGTARDGYFQVSAQLSHSAQIFGQELFCT